MLKKYISFAKALKNNSINDITDTLYRSSSSNAPAMSTITDSTNNNIFSTINNQFNKNQIMTLLKKLLNY